MMKQSKNKKGRLAKSTLSVVLAASMVMTSSSFVWASPVEEIQDVVEVSAYGLEEVVGEAVSKGPADWTTALEVEESDYNGTITKSVTFSWKIIPVNGREAALEGDAATLSAGQLTGADVGSVVTCTVNGTDNGDSPQDPVEVRFNITAHELTAEELALKPIDTQEYTGEAIEPTVEFSANTKGLTADDYSVEYTGNQEVGNDRGKVTVSLTEAGEAKGYLLPENMEEDSARVLTAAFTIGKADLSNYTTALAVEGLTYNGGEQYPVTGALRVTNKDTGAELLIPDGEYEVTYDPEAVQDAGDYTVASIVATNESTNFKGEISEISGDGFTVAKKEAAFEISGPVEDQSYTGAEIKPDVTIVDDAGTTVEEADYELIYPKDCTSVGEKKVVIKSTGERNYAPSENAGEYSYNVVKATVDHVAAAQGKYEYTSKAIEPEVVIYADDAGEKPIKAVKDVDYAVTYSNNTNVTKDAKGVVTFKGALAGLGSKSFTFEITPRTAVEANAVITAPKDQKFTFDGKAKKPVVSSVSYMFTGATVALVEGKDYEVEDLKAIDADTYSADITGKGNYSGTLGSVAFKIEKSAFNAATVTAKADPIAYGTGNSKPTFVVTNIATGEVVKDDEYTVKYLDKGTETDKFPTDMGDYKAVISYTKADGNYTATANDKITADYTIGGETLQNAAVTYEQEVDYNPLAETGTVPKITVVAFGTKSLKEADKDGKNGDYKVEYPKAEDCKEVGTYTIKLIGLNKLAGQTREVTFKVVPLTIIDDMVSEVTAGTTHIGTVGAPFFTITYGAAQKAAASYKLVEGKDYDVVNDAANKMVTITGKGNFKTETPIKKTYKITTGEMNLADPSIKAEVKGTYNYDGTAKEPKIDDITLTEIYEGGSWTLIKDTDYQATVTYRDNVAAGKGVVILTGKGRYTGTKEVEFDIQGIDITAEHKLDTTDLDKLALAYNKQNQISAITGAVKVINAKTLVPLVKDKDYKITVLQGEKEVTEAINPGMYTVVVEGDGNYTGKFTYNVSIAGINLNTVANISSDIKDQAYTGKEITPEVTVTSKDATVKLVKDTDYTVSYLNNIEIGTAYAVVEGAGIYGGTYLVPFKITGTDISGAAVTVNGTYTYTGEAIVPTVTVKVGDTVIDPANYDVVATDNTNAGTAKFTVTGKNDYTGTTKEATFEIGKADQKLAVSKTIADALKIRNTNANTYTLKVTGARTKLSYASSNQKVATVASNGKISFKHVCGKATITVTASGDENHNAATLKVAVAVKPATPKITITARAKGFNAKATTIKDITGYQVGYSTDKNFAASKTTKKLVKTTKALNKNFSGLSAKKGYYVRVRAYKINSNGTVYWGNWTSAKKITTK